METLIAEKWNALLDLHWPEYVEINKVETYGCYTAQNYSPYCLYLMTPLTSEEQEPVDPIGEDEYILEYGDLTRN